MTRIKKAAYIVWLVMVVWFLRALDRLVSALALKSRHLSWRVGNEPGQQYLALKANDVRVLAVRYHNRIFQAKVAWYKH